MTATTVPWRVVLTAALVAVLALGLLIGYAWADGRDGHHLQMRGMPGHMTSMPMGSMNAMPGDMKSMPMGPMHGYD